MNLPNAFDFEDLRTGMTILVPATITNILSVAGQDPRTQVVIVQLIDGQGVHTNFRNLRPFAPELIGMEPAEVIEEEGPEYDAEIMAIKGISPKLVQILWNNDVKTLDDLKHTDNMFLASLPEFSSRHVSAIRNAYPYEGPRTAEPTTPTNTEGTVAKEEAIDTPSRSPQTPATTEAEKPPLTEND